jgi:hypothetical protein
VPALRRPVARTRPATLRRKPVAWAAAITAAGAIVAVVPGATASGAGTATFADAEQARSICGLENFVSWLHAHHAKGYIGEVGWPGRANQVLNGDGAKFNAVARMWYDRADQAKLWVTYHDFTEINSYTDTVAGYFSKVPSTPIDSSNDQEAVIQAHPTSRKYLRGINTLDGTEGFLEKQENDPFSNKVPGVYGVGYSYDSPASYAFLAARGFKVVRLAIRWERIQNQLYGPLAKTEVGHLRDVLAAMHANGIRAILDIHNDGRYDIAGKDMRGHPHNLGTAEVPGTAFRNLWRRMARTFGHNKSVVAFDLMNEPFWVVPAQWRQFSQQAVNAIRAAGSKKTIMVAGAIWSSAPWWKRDNPHPWIHDPAHNFRYEAHQYFGEHGAKYMSYTKENAQAESEGYGPDSNC